MTVDPIQALAALGAQNQVVPGATAPLPARAPVSFAQMMVDGVEQTNQKILNSERMALAATLDDSISPHRVAFAQLEALNSLKLLMQVRSRLVEGYQEIMRMQL
jgi:flagellar hook-basal body complex protein FliE